MGGANEANDVLQEANLKLCRKAAEYDPQQPFLRWAYAFARLEVMAWRKRQQRSRLVLDEDLLALVEADCQAAAGSAEQQLAALEKCVEKLPPRQRELIAARYGKGEAVQAIAARLAQPENALAALFYRVRKALGDCVESALKQEAAT
jgi:RNA polymerase sigma-70 factor (ECF subfamily)